MTEKQILELGFQINYDDGGGDWDKYHYYTLEIVNGLELISNASDEPRKDDEWYVEFFDTYDKLRIYDYKDLKQLIEILEKAKRKTAEYVKIK